MVKKFLNFFREDLEKYFRRDMVRRLYKNGDEIGENCSIQPGVIFDYSHCWLIKIGNNVTIAPQA